MMLLHSLITLLQLCLWTEPIRSQQLQSCRLLLNFLHRKRSTADKLYSPPPLLQPCSLLHARPLAAARKSPHCDYTSSPWSPPTELWAVPQTENCCAFLLPQHLRCSGEIWKGTLILPKDTPTSVFDQRSGRGLWLSQIPSNWAAHTAMQLPLMPQVQLVCLPMPGSGRPAHICISMCLNTLLLGLQKCNIYKNGPSRWTQAHWDTGQC